MVFVLLFLHCIQINGYNKLFPRQTLILWRLKELKEQVKVTRFCYNQNYFLFIISNYHLFVSTRFDERVRDLLDFSIYLDISDEVKFAWKIQVS
jgi:phosphoribulokinase